MPMPMLVLVYALALVMVMDDKVAEWPWEGTCDGVMPCGGPWEGPWDGVCERL